MNKNEVVNSALSANAGQSTRSEQLQDYSKFFVDPIHSNILEQNTHQLIFGRRGSGKTLLIGALNEKIQANVKATNTISFSYTATRFRNSAEYGSLKPTIKERAHAYFHSFIEQLSRDVFLYADFILKKQTLLDYFRLSHQEDSQRRDRLITCVLQLLEATRYGTEFPALSSVISSREHQQKRQSKDAEKAKVEVKGNLSLDNLAVSLGAFLQREKLTSTESATILNILYETNRGFNPKRIRDLLVEIVEILGLEYIIIFIDEWMSLDECQVEFAERLRRCLFGERSISVKIAADPYQSVFNNGGQKHNFRGLEVGADIFEAVNLDLPFRDPSRQYKLFSEALYRRLAYFEPAMVECFGGSPLVNPDYFVTSVFSNKSSFLELCNGSQGICRDFHTMFQSCAKAQNWDVSTSKINFNGVRKAILDKTFGTYGTVAESIDSNKLLFNAIRPHLMNSGTRYFVIASPRNQHSRGINDLLSKRIIHVTPTEQIHATLRGEYGIFELDYGLYLDLMTAREYSTGTQPVQEYDSTEASSITISNVSRYLLDLSSFEEDEEKIILCKHCSKEFSSFERSYKAQQLCSHCFLKN